MSTKKISIDAGNGATNAVQETKNGNIKTIMFPSVRAMATGDTLGIGGEMQIDYVDWGGNRYVVGDDVFSTRRAVERHQGINRYGNEFVLFLIATAIAKLGNKKEDIDLTIFAPPQMYTDAKIAIEKRFKELGYKLAITLKGDKSARVFTIKSVTVLPEGIGAAACFILDKNGKTTDATELKGRVIILDSGMYTLDVLLLEDGSFNPETLRTATWENQGIKAHIIDPILASVKKQSEDFALLTDNDIDRVLRCGIETGDFTLRAGNAEVDLKSAFDKRCMRYAEWIANNIIDANFAGLRGYNALIPVGGGDTYIRKHLTAYYDKSKIKQVPVDSLFANAIGGLRLALSKQPQA